MATTSDWQSAWNSSGLPDDSKLERAAQQRGFIWWKPGYKLSWAPHEDPTGPSSLRVVVHDEKGQLLTPPADFPCTRIAGIGRTQFVAASFEAATKFSPFGRATKQMFGFAPVEGNACSEAFFQEALRVFHPNGKEYLDAVAACKNHFLVNPSTKGRNKRAKIESPEEIIAKYRKQLDDPDNYNKRGITFPSTGDTIKLYHKVANKKLEEGKKLAKPYEETGFASEECMKFYSDKKIKPSTVGIYCPNGKRYSGDPNNIYSLTKAMFYVEFYRDASHDNGTIAITSRLTRIQSFGMKLRDGNDDDVMDDFTNATDDLSPNKSTNDTVDDFIDNFE